VVNPEPHPVIAAQTEAVGSSVEVDRARPACGEVIDRNLGGRAAAAPVEIPIGIIAAECGRAAQVFVAPILAAPAGDHGRAGADGYPVDADGRASALLKVLDAQLMHSGT